LLVTRNSVLKSQSLHHENVGSYRGTLSQLAEKLPKNLSL
jgi:hypothetical protein